MSACLPNEVILHCVARSHGALVIILAGTYASVVLSPQLDAVGRAASARMDLAPAPPPQRKEEDEERISVHIADLCCSFVLPCDASSVLPTR